MALPNYDQIDGNTAAIPPQVSVTVDAYGNREFQNEPCSSGNSLQTSADALLGSTPTDCKKKLSEQDEIVALDGLILAENNEPLTECGIGPYRPECLQKFATRKCMLFWMCWFCFVQVGIHFMSFNSWLVNHFHDPSAINPFLVYIKPVFFI